MRLPSQSSQALFQRRDAIGCIAATAASFAIGRVFADQKEALVTFEDLAKTADAPVLKTDFLTSPVIVKSIEVLRNGGTLLLRTRSTEGVEAITVPHQGKTGTALAVLMESVIPRFVGKDARQIENLQWEAYRHASNYKMQGLLFWVAFAAVEMALLELMGRSAKRSVAEFFGGVVRRDIGVYFASSNRGNTPAQEIAHLEKLVSDSGVRALKFRLGGRMSKNADSLPGRSEALIPLARRTFGEGFTLHADANSSYDAAEAIRIGRLMEEYGYGFFEEPCEFDDLWSTKKVADTLAIPIALGEQEYSMHRWRWCISERVADIVQPDLYYGGGLIRATRVARMAAAAGMTVVPHMSGGGLGYLDVVHFASWTPNAGPHMEFKGTNGLPVICDSSSLRCEKGVVRCPSGPGLGVEIDPDFVRKAAVVRV